MKRLTMVALASGLIAVTALFGSGSDVALGATVDVEVLAFDVVDPSTGLITSAITIEAGDTLDLVVRETVKSVPAAFNVDDNAVAKPMKGKYKCKKPSGPQCHWVDPAGKKFWVAKGTKIEVLADGKCNFEPPSPAVPYQYDPCKVAFQHVKPKVSEAGLTLDITGNTWLPSLDEIGTHVLTWELEAIPDAGDVDSNPANNFASTSVTITVVALGGGGGIAEPIVLGSDSAAQASDSSSGRDYTVPVAAAAAGAVTLLALTGGGWYARRHWLR